MGRQLIICVEANKESKSDYIYIKKTIEEFFDLDLSVVKLSPIYMGGRGNYASNKIRKEIKRLSNQYNSTSLNNENSVIFCFDCDDYDTNSEDENFITRAKQFCDKNNYDFVWFCRDVEDVYLKRKVPDNQKRKEADRFITGKKIESVRAEVLSEKGNSLSDFRIHRSNIFSVLEKYLKKK